MIPATTIDPSRRLDFPFRLRRAGSKTFIFVDEDGAAVDISGFAFQLNIKEYPGARTNVISLTVGSGLTVGGAGNNELVATFTASQTNVKEAQYYWELYKGSTSKTYLNGWAPAHNGVFDGVSNDTSTITIDDSGIVNITISDSVGGSDLSNKEKIDKVHTYNSPAGGDYTLSTNDFNPADSTQTTVVKSVNNSPVNYTIPPGIPVGSIAYVFLEGTATVTFLSGIGVTVASTAGVLTSPGQFSIVAIVCTAINMYTLQNGFNGVPVSRTIAGVDLSSDISAVELRSAMGLSERTVLENNVSNSTTSLADVTGLSFAVTNGERYHFRFWIMYTVPSAVVGTRFTINGPSTTLLGYKSEYATGTGSTTINNRNDYDQPAAAGANSANATSNIAIIEGEIQPSADGTVIARFASEVGASAVTVLAQHSFVEYRVVS